MFFKKVFWIVLMRQKKGNSTVRRWTTRCHYKTTHWQGPFLKRWNELGQFSYLLEDAAHLNLEHNNVKYLLDPVCLCQQLRVDLFLSLTEVQSATTVLNLGPLSSHIWEYQQQVTHPSLTGHKIIILPSKKSKIIVITLNSLLTGK